MKQDFQTPMCHRVCYWKISEPCFGQAAAIKTQHSTTCQQQFTCSKGIIHPQAGVYPIRTGPEFHRTTAASTCRNTSHLFAPIATQPWLHQLAPPSETFWKYRPLRSIVPLTPRHHHPFEQPASPPSKLAKSVPLLLVMALYLVLIATYLGLIIGSNHPDREQIGRRSRAAMRAHSFPYRCDILASCYTSEQVKIERGGFHETHPGG